MLAGAGKVKPPFLVQGVEPGEVLPLELVPEDVDGDEAPFFRLVDFSARREPASGNDAVHVDVVEHFLVPRVEHLDDAECRPEAAFVRREFQQGLGAAFVQEAVNELLVLINERVQLVRLREHDMEVRRVDDIRPALVDPEFLLHGLAVWAVPVAAGTGVGFLVAAVLADADVVTERPGLALHVRLETDAVKKAFVCHAEDVPDGEPGGRRPDFHVRRPPPICSSGLAIAHCLAAARYT